MRERGKTWAQLVGMAALLWAGCAERQFHNPFDLDRDEDGVLAVYDCDDTDPSRAGPCAIGEV